MKILDREARYDSILTVSEKLIRFADRLPGQSGSFDFNGFFEIVIAAHEKAASGNLAEQNQVLKTYTEYLKNNELATIRRELSDLKIAHDTREKEQALEASLSLLQANKRTNTLLIISIVATLIALLSLGYAFRSVRNKNQLLETQNDTIKVLIRELHHRVKNNLQVISSLLGLQSLKLEGEEAKAAFEEGKSRVNAMAMIHQKLYQEENLEKVDINDYLQELVDNLRSSFDTESTVKVNLDVTRAQFNIDKAIPIGLILNELITNSFKYAFENIQEPLLDIRLLQEKDRFNLTVSDNGREFDEKFDLSNSPSFGLKLVNLLVNQLDGSITLKQTSERKTFSIQFS